jgi:dephospho-CoA kinase
MKTAIVLVGGDRTGKTTFAHALAEARHAALYETSYPLRNLYLEVAGVRICEANKDKLRQDLITLGDMVTRHDPARLVKLAMGESLRPPRILVSGIRRRKEYESTVAMLEERGYLVKTLYLIRDSDFNHPPFDLQGIELEVIDNAGSVYELREKAYTLNIS